MIKLTTSQGQNLIDVAVQEYGAAEAVWQLLKDNPTLDLFDPLAAGTEISIDPEKIIKPAIRNYFAKRGQRINTGDTQSPFTLGNPAIHYFSTLPIHSNDEKVNIDGTVRNFVGDRDGTVFPSRANKGNTLTFQVWETAKFQGNNSLVVSYYECISQTFKLSSALWKATTATGNPGYEFQIPNGEITHNLKFWPQGYIPTTEEQTRTDLVGNVVLWVTGEDGSSSIMYDISGNKRHLVVFSAQADWVVFDGDGVNSFSALLSFLNEYGYTDLGGSVYKPASALNRTLDADGVALANVGLVRKNGKIVNSPAASVANNAILTFSNQIPNTRPTAVTIGAGTATGTYNAGNGQFTIGASGAGTIEYFTVTAGGETFDVYLCAGAGTGQVWKRGSIQIEIALPGSTSWATTNANAVLQNKGGRKAENMEVGTLALTTPINFGTGGFKIEWVGINYSMFLPTDPESKRVYLLVGATIGTDYIFVNQGQITIAQNGLIHNVIFPAPSTSGILPNRLNTTVSVEKDIVNSRWRFIVNGQITDIPAASSSGTFAESYELDFLHNILLGDANYNRINRFSVYDAADVEIHRWTPVSSLIDTIGGNNITSNLQRTGYIISALDASGNSTGSDVTGSILEEGYGKKFFDFGESLIYNTNRDPKLLQIGYDDTSEPYADIIAESLDQKQFSRHEPTVNPQKKSDILKYPATPTQQQINRTKKFLEL